MSEEQHKELCKWAATRPTRSILEACRTRIPGPGFRGDFVALMRSLEDRRIAFRENTIMGKMLKEGV